MSVIYYANIENVLWNNIKNLLYIVPELERTAISELRFEKDKCRTLIGKILLLQILHDETYWNKDTLPIFSYNEYKKPQIEKSLNLGCFNISHSGNIVACAYTNEGDIGLDVEEIVAVNISEFREVLTLEEYNLLNSDPDFFRLWTIKEAIMKAVGKGFYIDPRSIIIPENLEDSFCLNVEDMKLHVYSQHLSKNYMLAIAQQINQNIDLKKIHLT